MAVTLLLVRHGQTEDNVARLIQGQRPGKLTEEGEKQASRIGVLLEKKHIDIFISSDLRRAIDTANIINQSLHLKLITDPLLRERDFGKYTGMPYGVNISPDAADVEPVAQLYSRAKKWMQQICADYDHKTILAVSHGLFLRVLQSAYLNKTLKEIEPMDNTEIREFIIRTPLCLSTNDDEIGAFES